MTLIAEEILEPSLPIVDAHHHVWFYDEAALASLAKLPKGALRDILPVFNRYPKYLFDELNNDVTSGHNIRATVFITAGAMFKVNGPTELRSVGEVEAVNGIAAMAASRKFGPALLCAGIVGGVDLRLGGRVHETLLAHLQAGGGRYRGVRSSLAYDPDPTVFGGAAGPNVMRDPMFREGLNCLAPLNLSFEALVLEPQLPELVELAEAFPDTSIILNHVGMPLLMGAYSGQRDLRFSQWRESMRHLVACTNVTVKLGGLGHRFLSSPYFLASKPASSQQLAEEWRPYIEACIELFGVDRCMFESNYPPDAATADYATIWNAFKRITAGASSSEKEALFSRTATRVYRLELE